MTDYSPWLRGLAQKGGKSVVGNIDARSLGRIADELDRLRAEIERLRRTLIEAKLQLEYLADKFQPTSIGVATVARIEYVLADEGGRDG